MLCTHTMYSKSSESLPLFDHTLRNTKLSGYDILLKVIRDVKWDAEKRKHILGIFIRQHSGISYIKVLRYGGEKMILMV